MFFVVVVVVRLGNEDNQNRNFCLSLFSFILGSPAEQIVCSSNFFFFKLLHFETDPAEWNEGFMLC